MASVMGEPEKKKGKANARAVAGVMGRLSARRRGKVVR
jgi:hypothetical protein